MGPTCRVLGLHLIRGAQFFLLQVLCLGTLVWMLLMMTLDEAFSTGKGVSLLVRRVRKIESEWPKFMLMSLDDDDKGCCPRRVLIVD